MLAGNGKLKQSELEDAELLSNTINASRPSLPRELDLFINAIVSEPAGLVISRQVLAKFCKATPRIVDRDVRRQVIASALESLQPRIVTFEEQVSLPIVLFSSRN